MIKINLAKAMRDADDGESSVESGVDDDESLLCEESEDEVRDDFLMDDSRDEIDAEDKE